MARSALQRSYSKLRSTKGKFCKGKATKTQVKKAASAYVQQAVKKGQTRTEAQKKANRVLSSGCSMSSAVRGKKKTASRKKKSTRTTTRTRRRRTK